MASSMLKRSGSFLESSPKRPRTEPRLKTPKAFSNFANLKVEDLSNDSTGDNLRDRVKDFELDTDDEDILPWNEIHGFDKLKERLDTGIFIGQEPGVRGRKPRMPEGVLLHGPRGTGKTSIVNSFAKHYHLKAFMVTADRMDILQGRTEKMLRYLFREAQNSQPCVLFFEEIDRFLGQRGRSESSIASYVAMIKTLWSDLMLARAQVFIFGATNEPWEVPMTDLSHRFKVIEFAGVPDEETRHRVLKFNVSETDTINSEQMRVLATLTEGYTGSDIVCAVIAAGTELIDEVRTAQSWRKVDIPSGKFIYPTTSESSDRAISFYDLPEDDRRCVRARPLTFEALRKIFDQGSGDSRLRKVTQAVIQKYVDWEKELGKR